MEILSASEARAKLFSLVEQVNKDHSPRMITSRQGDAVLLSKNDWESIQETLYLVSIPGLRDSIRKGMAEPLHKSSKVELMPERLRSLRVRRRAPPLGSARQRVPG